MGVNRAIMFFGYVETHRGLYDYLRRCGFELMFRDVEVQEGRIKGNVDIFLTVTLMDMLQEGIFDTAMLVTSDGDFFDLIERLKRDGKFGNLMSPNAQKRCSRLISRSAGGNISYFPEVKHKFAENILLEKRPPRSVETTFGNFWNYFEVKHKFGKYEGTAPQCRNNFWNGRYEIFEGSPCAECRNNFWN